MEDVLSVYHLPNAHEYPVVCMDESNKQLIGEVRSPIPGKPGHPQRMDDEYVRNGVADIFMEGEPLTGKRHVTVTERRTRKDWAHQIKSMLDETFEPQEAQRLASRLETPYTPKHGSRLNMAEIERSVLKRQCLDRRIADMATLKAEVLAWENHRNSSVNSINWQFTTIEARVKLRRLYPKF